MKKMFLKSLFLFVIMFGFVMISRAETIKYDDIKDNNWVDMWNVSENISAGYYKLSSDVYFDKQKVSDLAEGESIYIDLNGYKLTYGGWANWEDEENDIPPKYLGTVNAAFYGTKGNIYFFDSTKDDNSIDIDFSLVDGFDKTVIQGITYNANVWRSMIISKNIEIYDSVLKDINHAGAISIIGNEIYIDNSELDITALKVANKLDIIDSKAHFYAEQYSIVYNGPVESLISGSELSYTELVFYKMDGYNIKSDLVIEDTVIKTSSTRDFSEAISIETSSLKIVDSTIEKISHIKVNPSEDFRYEVNNSKINFVSEQSIPFYNNGFYSYGPSHKADLYIIDSELTNTTASMFSGFNDVVVSNSKIKAGTLNPRYYEYIFLYCNNSINIDSSNIDSNGGFISGSTKEITVTNTNVKAISTNSTFINASGASVNFTNSPITSRTDFRGSDANNFVSKNITLNNSPYVGGIIMAYGNVSIDKSNLDVKHAGNGQSIINVYGNFVIKDSNIINLDTEGANNGFMLINGDISINNSEIKTSSDSIKPKTVAEVTVMGAAVIDNLKYYGSGINVGSLDLNNSELKINSEDNVSMLTVRGTTTIKKSSISRLGSNRRGYYWFIDGMGDVNVSDSKFISDGIHDDFVNKAAYNSTYVGIGTRGNLTFENVSYVAPRISAKNIVIKNSDLVMYAYKSIAAFAASNISLSDTSVEFYAEELNSSLYVGDGVFNLNNCKLKTNTNVALHSKVFIDGKFSVESAGDYDIYFDEFGDVAFGENFMLENEAGIFSIPNEEDITLPVVRLGFETTVEEYKKRTQKFVNPYHDEYMLRYEKEDQNLYWNLKQKITFIDREDSDIQYFFKSEHVNKDDVVSFVLDGKLYEFVGWFSNPDGTGEQFVSGSSVEEDDLVYYAYWKVSDVPVTGSSISGVMYFVVGLTILLIGMLYIGRKNKVIFRV